MKALRRSFDHITDLELIEAWHAAIAAPSKRLKVVEAGHMCLFEAPASFIEFMDPIRMAALK